MSTKFKQKMLINVEDDETRIAVITNHTLDNLYIEQTHRERTVGNIYRGEVVKIQSSFQAAFVDYGASRHGFLASSDINPHLFKSKSTRKDRYSIDNLLKPGQIVMVQVVKEEIHHKGATLTTNISLPGRFVVFMPNSDKGGVSRKIEDVEQRNRLKLLLEGLGAEDASAIIRTAGMDRSLAELKRDFMMLRRKWQRIQEEFQSGEAPGPIYQELDAVCRMLRDYFTDNIEEVWIDDPESFQRALEFFRANIPDKQKRLHLYLGDRSLFSVYHIEEQIEMLSNSRVSLPSGGSLVIESTEALVAIDVNSGKSNQESSIEDTAMRTNLEAAEEISRQLLLRNLGGLIVIDFIDMEHASNRDKVVERMEDCMHSDKAKWTLGSISQFGLLEMSRQRINSALYQGQKTPCPTCLGRGSMPSLPSMANSFIRRVREYSVDGNVKEVQGRVSLDLATYLFNRKRKQLDQMEMEFGVRVFITTDPSLSLAHPPEFEVKTKRETEEDAARPASDRSLEGARDRQRREREAAPSRERQDMRDNRPQRGKPPRRKGREFEETTTTNDKYSNNRYQEDEKENLSPRIQEQEEYAEPSQMDAEIIEDAPVNLASVADYAVPVLPEVIEVPFEKIKGNIYNSIHQDAPPNKLMFLPIKMSPIRAKYLSMPAGSILFRSYHRGDVKIVDEIPVLPQTINHEIPIQAAEDIEGGNQNLDSMNTTPEQEIEVAPQPRMRTHAKPERSPRQKVSKIVDITDSAPFPAAYMANEALSASKYHTDLESRVQLDPRDSLPADEEREVGNEKYLAQVDDGEINQGYVATDSNEGEFNDDRDEDGDEDNGPDPYNSVASDDANNEPGNSETKPRKRYARPFHRRGYHRKPKPRGSEKPRVVTKDIL